MACLGLHVSSSLLLGVAGVSAAVVVEGMGVGGCLLAHVYS